VSGRLRLAVLHARGLGIDHYWCHLWERTRAFAEPEYVAMAGPRTDCVAAAHLSPIREIVDPAVPGSLEAVVRHFRERRIRVAVPQIATDACRHIRYFTALLGRLRDEGVRIVATVHNVLPHDVFPVDRGELAALYRQCDAFLVGNESQRELLEAHFAIGDRPVGLAPQGPYRRLALGRHDRASARAFLGLPAAGPGILFFGNVRPNKGLDRLLAAAPALHMRRPDAWLHLSVNPRLLEPADRADAEARLAALAREPGTFVRCEPVPSDWIEPTFVACDVVALPYRALSQSAIVNLARAFGRPVVASEAFARAERLAPGEGRVVACEDPTALAEGIAAVLADRVQPPPPDDSPWDRNAAALRAACEAVLGAR
jgi:glycosyltransferase involved in cell wall biosynthesis